MGHTFRVGLTGGIASGKSTVADLFARLGVPIVDTDIIAREVVQPGMPALAAIEKQFGSAVIAMDGQLDRAVMRKIVFADDKARQKLEAITHPVIRTATEQQAKRAQGPYQIIVVPLLVGSPLLQFVDRVLVVDCEEQEQIRRLVQRDGGSEAEAQRILASQSSRKSRLAIADDVIRNDKDLANLQRQVDEMHLRYLGLARPA